MKSLFSVRMLIDPKNSRYWLCGILPIFSVMGLLLITCTSFVAKDQKEKYLKWGWEMTRDSNCNACEDQCRPPGSLSLPKGVVSQTSNLERLPLWGRRNNGVNSSANLFSAAVGIKQKKLVDKMVKKFLSSGFIVMLFHYDGILDEWKDLKWTDTVIHVSAVNQTKWWFAKRFLHPDIVAEYDYIFLWDEDLGVENFHPKRYVSIVRKEALEISQPALDASKSEVHHLITARGRRSTIHRRTYKNGDSGIECDTKSKDPPCTGWVEVMAPVFSRAAWRCVWYMIQNDLIHGWGLDLQLGYCVEGDRTKKIGVVDAEYIVHYGFPTLGEPKIREPFNASASGHRVEVRRQSYNEYKVFRRRWSAAAKHDACWADPYPKSSGPSMF